MAKQADRMPRSNGRSWGGGTTRTFGTRKEATAKLQRR